jgi:flagellar export protein FliJ
MKPFKLQSVLNYRQTLCNIAQQELCKSLEMETLLQANLQKVREELLTLYADLEKKQQDGITVDELMLYENRCSHTTEAVQNLEDELILVRQAIASKRQAVCETDRDKKLLKKLKEKHICSQNDIINKKEKSELDEIAIQAHGR